MSETEAQKRERILRSERTHDEPPTGIVAAIPPGQPPGEDIDAALHKLLACPDDWIAGRGGPITSFVVHCTAATNPAASTANFFHSCASSHGSTQYVLDDNTGFLCVPLNAICAGAPPLNQEGVHAEMPGLVTWSRAVWLSHMDQLRRMAFHAARVCKANNLPVRLLRTADLLRLGEKAQGITAHVFITEAFHQSTHTDPGPNFPWDVFMLLVQHFFDGGGDDVTPEQAKVIEDARVFLTSLRKNLGQLADPTKPASPIGAGQRVAKATKGSEDGGGSGGASKTHIHDERVTGPPREP